MSSVFSIREACPFCDSSSDERIGTVLYHDTAEANRSLANIRGELFLCRECGVAYPSHVYDIVAFASLYEESFKKLNYFNDSFLQNCRLALLKGILATPYMDSLRARFLDFSTLRAFQTPILLKRTKGIDILDIGCGFGEFSSIYSKMNNRVVATEVIQSLVQIVKDLGIDCRFGELEGIDFEEATFDTILLRASYYRTRRPKETMRKLRDLLRSDGEIALLDPCPGREGACYFFEKQFPQGQFYITDRDTYFGMLEERFGMRAAFSRQIYGRPIAPLRQIRLLGNIFGFCELVSANLFRYKPYMLSYNLVKRDVE